MSHKNYTPRKFHQTPTEEAIYIDIIELFDSPIQTLIDDIKDDPEAYTYTIDDLEQYLFKYNIKH